MATDTRTVYTSTALEVLTSANLEKFPKGWIGVATTTSTPAVSSADTTLLTIDVTIPADRMVRVGCYAQVLDGGSNAVGGVIYVEEGSTNLGRIHRHPDGTPQSFASGAVLIDGPSAGSHTYKLIGSLDSGDYSWFGTTTLYVEDIGPASS